MNKIVLFFLLSLFTNLHAQTLNATFIEINKSDSGFPMDITKGDTKVYFSANNGVHGRELYCYDLITQNTRLVKDIRPGDGSSIEADQYGSYFFTVGDILYFKVEFPTNSLWRSDGTDEGTYKLIDLTDINFDNNPKKNMAAYNGNLFFSVYDQTNGFELWKSNGTPEGTILLKDINPGSASSNISNMFVLNNNLYFTANTPQFGTELWKSNGTAQGTNLLKDINPLTSSGASGPIMVMGNNFYFSANEGINGYEIWKSDGTAEGTQLLKDVVSGTNGASLILTGNKTVENYFLFTSESGNEKKNLWKSDGTSAGTIMLKEYETTPGGINNFYDFVNLNGSIYFTAGSYGTKKQIWKTDGTVSGTQLVVDIYQDYNNRIDQLSSAQNNIIFSTQSIGGSLETLIWSSNGTNAGTNPLNGLKKLNSTAANLHFEPVNGKVLFQAYSGEENGCELWITDGTSENTNLVEDLNKKYPGFRGYGIALGNKYIFTGNNGTTGIEPFISDGTINGTHLLKNIDSSDYNSINLERYTLKNIFKQLGNYVYFTAYNNTTGIELYKTDGTPENTVPVKDIAASTGSSIPEYTYTMEYNDVLYFKANDMIHGDELWRTDGTTEGTYMLKDIYSGSQSGITASNLLKEEREGYTVFNGKLYFNARDESGFGVWQTDGTQQGTVKLYPNKYVLNATSNKLYLMSVENNSTYGPNALWSATGTNEDTTPVGNWLWGTGEKFKQNCIFNDELYFYAPVQENGNCIVKTDGTQEGTIIVKTFPFETEISSFDICGDYIYFRKSYEIWRTDGTSEGTIFVDGGDPSFFVAKLTCFNNKILYTNTMDIETLWYTPANGETIVSSLPINFTNNTLTNTDNNVNYIAGIVGNTIFFSGGNMESSTELIAAYSGPLASLQHFEENKAKNEQFIVYPNPTNGIINITSVNDAIIRIATVYDFTGKKILEKNIDGTSGTIELPELTKGMYFLSIKTDMTSITKKIIYN